MIDRCRVDGYIDGNKNKDGETEIDRWRVMVK